MLHPAIYIGIIFSATYFIAYISFFFFLKKRSSIFILDPPSDRGLHEVAVPRGGGVILLITTSIASIWSGFEFGFSKAFCLIGFLIFSMCVVGYIDDKFKLSVITRIVLGLIISTSISIVTIQNNNIFLFSNTLNLPIPFLLVTSSLCLFWLINLFNFMDGSDGLIGIYSFSIATTIGSWFLFNDNIVLALLNFSLAGSLAAFLAFNWSPAKIFLGDSGSLGLGAWFGSMLLIGVNEYKIPFEAFVLLLGYLLYDSGVTIIKRFIKRENIVQPHREHLYQRLIVSGYSHSSVAYMVGFVSLILVFLSSIIIAYPQSSKIMSVLGILMLIKINIVGTIMINKKNKVT